MLSPRLLRAETRGLGKSPRVCLTISFVPVDLCHTHKPRGGGRSGLSSRSPPTSASGSTRNRGKHAGPPGAETGATRAPVPERALA